MNISPPGTLRNAKKKNVTVQGSGLVKVNKRKATPEPVNAYQLNTQKGYVTVDHKLSHLTVGNAHPTVLQITLKKWPIFRRVGIAHHFRLISYEL